MWQVLLSVGDKKTEILLLLGVALSQGTFHLVSSFSSCHCGNICGEICECLFADGVSGHRSPLVGKYVCNMWTAGGCLGRGESRASEIIHLGCR